VTLINFSSITKLPSKFWISSKKKSTRIFYISSIKKIDKDILYFLHQKNRQGIFEISTSRKSTKLMLSFSCFYFMKEVVFFNVTFDVFTNITKISTTFHFLLLFTVRVSCNKLVTKYVFGIDQNHLVRMVSPIDYISNVSNAWVKISPMKC